jgi:hypothetical protein
MFWKKVMGSACSLLLQQLCLPPASCWFLVDLIFDPEDGGSMALQNISERLLNHTVLHSRLYTILSLRFLYGDEMGVLYIFSLDHAVHDQPVTVCDCLKFSHNLIDMLHHKSERKEIMFLKVFTNKVENTLQ